MYIYDHMPKHSVCLLKEFAPIWAHILSSLETPSSSRWETDSGGRRAGEEPCILWHNINMCIYTYTALSCVVL